MNYLAFHLPKKLRLPARRKLFVLRYGQVFRVFAPGVTSECSFLSQGGGRGSPGRERWRAVVLRGVGVG